MVGNEQELGKSGTAVPRERWGTCLWREVGRTGRLWRYVLGYLKWLLPVVFQFGHRKMVYFPFSMENQWVTLKYTLQEWNLPSHGLWISMSIKFFCRKKEHIAYSFSVFMVPLMPTHGQQFESHCLLLFFLFLFLFFPHQRLF